MVRPIYAAARRRHGEKGATLVARAVQIDDVPVDEIMEALEEAGDDLEDFAHALWRP
jgi:hypothetical protein